MSDEKEILYEAEGDDGQTYARSTQPAQHISAARDQQGRPVLAGVAQQLKGFKEPPHCTHKFENDQCVKCFAMRPCPKRLCDGSGWIFRTGAGETPRGIPITEGSTMCPCQRERIEAKARTAGHSREDVRRAFPRFPEGDDE